MRTLAKPMKTKKIQKQSGENTDKKKQTSKKISKTVFIDPFHYKIQTIQHQDADFLEKNLLQYLKGERQKMPKKQLKMRENFISFTNKKQSLTSLTSSNIKCGTKFVAKAIQQEKRIELVIIFYEQNRYEMLEKLFCLISKTKIPFIITRDIQSVRLEMAMKNLTCIGLTDSIISHKLSKLCTKCSVQIPWLVQKNWIPLKND